MESPVIDLGSGDGTFGSILLESGKIKSISLSIDISLKRILTGKNNSRVPGATIADTRNLPLKSGSVATVFSNGVLGCLRNAAEDHVDSTISEVHRVLQHQGTYFVSVQTPHFNENLALSKLLNKVGLFKLASFYVDRLNRRIGHAHDFQESEWREKLESSGFKIDNVHHYFTPVQGCWWSVLSFSFFRVFAILKLIGPRSIKLSAWFQEMLFRSVFKKEQSIPRSLKKKKAGYLLFVARKEA